MEVIIQHEDSEIVDDVKPRVNKVMHDCPKCSRSFANIGHMKCHFYRVHPEFKLTEFVECDPPDPPRICRFCGSEFETAKELKRHPCPGRDDEDDSKGTKTYLCAHCDSTFTNKTSVQLHCMRMHRKDGKVTCTTCKKSFASQPHLAAHMRIHKAEKKDSPESEELVKSEDISNDEEEMTIDEDVSKGNGVKLPPTEESPKQEAKPKFAFECSECGEGFKTGRSLQSHMSATHDKESLSFNCDQCDEKFNDQHSLREHRSRTHAIEKSFKCGECDQSFATNRALLMHARIHKTTDDVSFKCDSCEASFLTKQRLSVHVKQHTEKKFACAECGKKFQLKCHLSRHMKTHISST